jgi:hypothetical protein
MLAPLLAAEKIREITRGQLQRFSWRPSDASKTYTEGRTQAVCQPLRVIQISSPMISSRTPRLSRRHGDHQHLWIMAIVGCNSAIPDKCRHMAIDKDCIPAALRIYGSSQGTRRVRQVQGDRFQHQRPTCCATLPIDGTMIDSADNADSIKLSVCPAMPVAVAGVIEMMFVRKRHLPRGGRRCKLTCRDTLSQIQYVEVLARMIRTAFPASHGLYVCAFHRVCTSRTPKLANRVGFDINPAIDPI